MENLLRFEKLISDPNAKTADFVKAVLILDVKHLLNTHPGYDVHSCKYIGKNQFGQGVIEIILKKTGGAKIIQLN